MKHLTVGLAVGLCFGLGCRQYREIKNAPSEAQKISDISNVVARMKKQAEVAYFVSALTNQEFGELQAACPAATIRIKAKHHAELIKAKAMVDEAWPQP